MRALIIVAVLASVGLHGTAQSPSRAPRVVAIGDIHGAYDEFVALLRRAGLVDEALKWSGGRSTLVQTGDYTDRGADVRKVLDLLMRLEREAKAAGGQLVTLLGNHEVMNVIGDWRDVTPEICAAFATPKSEARRNEVYEDYTRLTASTTPPASAYTQTREEWMLAHPPGCIEYREAMGPSGVYGRWLRDKSIAAQVQDSLFMHAGVNPSRPLPKSIRDLSEQARSEIRRLDSQRQRLANKGLALPTFTLQQILEVSLAELRHAAMAIEAAKAERRPPPALDRRLLRESQELMNIASWSLVDPEGPLWFRGYAQWEELKTAPQVFAFLDAMKLSRIIVGHTVTPTRKILQRYGGRVVLIDTGMLTRTYMGTPAALEITAEGLKAIYPTEEVKLSASPATPAPLSPSHSRQQNSTR